MAVSFDQLSTHEALIEIARDFHARGWMAGTAGNLSARDAEGCFWITASGRPKGRLEGCDFLLISLSDGEVLERASPHDKPSAETAIHRAIYHCFPDARACVHVHTVDACIAAERLSAVTVELPLPGLEMLKGLGIWEENPRVGLPLFGNPLDVDRIAGAILSRFKASAPRVPALMVRGHGVTVWGAGLQEAYNRVEVLEFMLSYIARSHT